MTEETLTGIAVVGMAGRFPQSADINQFWRHLCGGRECLARFSLAELQAAGVPPALARNPSYVPVNGLLSDVELFDAGFFSMTPREASITDPQHRIFLELAWQALEHSGYDPSNYRGVIGVYAGCGSSSYLLHNLWSNRNGLADVGELRVKMANSQEYLATRVSYKLNLTGPSLSINTACSTSLVAVHVACDALLNFQCDMALGGGISIQLPQVKGYLYEPGGILSPDGHCRAFDADAHGTVSGNGGGVVVLKRLSDALADGDTIYAVIRGSAINNDGADKAGYTAPSVTGQASVISEAQDVAGVEPETIGYVETHGTGTPLGDPIEFAALTQAFRSRSERKQFCAIGSVKTNVGHLDEGAGVTGLIKTVLSLHHRQLPPSLHFKQPNPELACAESPFYVNTELRDWPAPDDGEPRRAAVSSFGIGGTNAHVVLEEAPEQAARPRVRPIQLLPLSANNSAALKDLRADLALWLDSRPEQELADTAYTLQVGRRQFPWRSFALGADTGEVVTTLKRAQSARGMQASADPPPVIFMFSGQGSQHPGMARGLYEREPVFRRWLDTCAERLRPLMNGDIRQLLYPASSEKERDALQALQQTETAQPALFALEYSLAQLWMHWGIRPQAMIGHSLGEYTAACIAGVLELDEALALVMIRGRLMQATPEGSMLAVPLNLAALQPYLTDGTEVAAVNAPDRCVVAGPTAAIERLAERLRDEGIQARPLHVSRAFHSELMTPALDAFAAELHRHHLRAPELPYISNLTGDWIRPHEASDPSYYVRHLRQPVQFAAGLARLLKDHPRAILLEVGPGQALAQAARRSAPAETVCLASLPQASSSADCYRVLLNSLGEMWERGAEVDWAAFAEAGRRRIALPGYPFQRQRHWIEARPETVSTVTVEDAAQASSDSAAKQPLDKWCYVPRWEAAASLPATRPEGHWLLLSDETTDALLAETLREAGCRVTVVRRSDRWARSDSGQYSLRPQSLEDYLSLFAALDEPPTQIVWLWSYGPAPDWRAEDWCYGLLALIQALDGQPSPPKLSIITSGLAAVAAGEGARLAVEKGSLHGFARSAALEYPQLSIRLIDLTAIDDRAQMAALPSLCTEASDESFVAWRAGQRWVPRYERLSSEARQAVMLRRHGVYLVTGGLGGIGLTLADDLARHWQARLVLIGRKALPPESDWPRLMADSGTEPSLRRTLRKLQSMKDSGGELLIEAADVADREQLSRVINKARERFGVVHGVIHAAGVADGALLARQTAEGMASVLAAKVSGTRLLAELFASEALDFCLLCSALSAVMGAHGQAAYCAANSFLDHFAQAAQTGWPLLSVDWDSWREVGMAANPEKTESEGASVAVRHPLLRTRVNGADGRTIYRAQMRAADQWVLSEHRLGEKSLLPGTAYLEMLCAAARDRSGVSSLDVQDLYLLQPLMLDSEETATLEITLTPRGDRYEFQISSQAQNGQKQLHAEGSVAPLNSPPPAELEANSNAPLHANGDDGSLARRLANFGPRWQCLKRLCGKDGEFAELALSEEYAAEAEEYMLHPALMDVATGFAVLGNHYDSALLPFAYRRLRLYQSLPPRLLSQLRAAREGEDGLHLDLRLLDEQGRVLAEVDDYHLRKSGRAAPGENHRLVLDQPGQLDSLRVESCARPAPGPGMAEIEVYATGLNFKEVLYAVGILPEPEGEGWQFGLECSGRISRVGEGVDERLIGQAVVAYAAGSLQSYALAPIAQTRPLPHGLSFAAGASLPAAFTTAYYALVKQARLEPGETVLIHAAAGGVGLAAVQVAHSLGAKVLATAGSERKRAFLREMGVAGVFDSRSDRFVEGVREHTSGRGVNVVLNSLSGDLLLKSLDCLAPYGRFLELGVRDIYAGLSLDMRRFAKAISFSAISVGPGMPGFADLFTEALDRFRDGTFKPSPHQVFPLTASATAFQHMAQARHIGKVVIALRPEAGSIPEPSTETVEHGISPAEGVALFGRALAAGRPQLIISTEELEERIARLRGLKLPDFESAPPGAGDRPDIDTPYAAPKDEQEKRLAAILERLLGLNRVGRDDDFFALGGDSLLGIQYVSQVNRELGSRLTLRDFFEHPTLAMLSTRLGQTMATTERRISTAPPSADYPLTHAQKRLWILAQNPSASVAYNMSYSLTLRGSLNPAALRKAFGLIVERHESLRTAFVIVNGEPRQQVRPAEPFSLPLLDLRGESEAGSAVSAEIRSEAHEPFSLEEPPLVRARLLRLAEDEHILLVSLHHIIADGLSLNVLMRELHAFYSALLADKRPELPPLSIQAKDFAVWQQEQLAGEAMQSHRAYWLEKLGGELPTLNLPTDRPRPPLQQFEGGQVALRLSVEAQKALQRTCQEEGVTLFMMLTAALKVLLHQATGQADILIGSPVAGRDRTELEGQIGYYLNNVVLRDTIRRSEPFTALLGRVRDTITEALAHQDYPFDLLVEELAVKPAPGHAPLFDVQINLMPAETPRLELGDLTVVGSVTNSQTTLFDLNFMFSDGPGGLAVEISYSTALFDSKSVERMGERLLRLLTAIGQEPASTVRSLCQLLEEHGAATTKDEFLAAALNINEEF